MTKEEFIKALEPYPDYLDIMFVYDGNGPYQEPVSQGDIKEIKEKDGDIMVRLRFRGEA